ncbi:unnamed protein product [Brassica oleracea]
MSSSKAETSPVRLLQDWYLLTQILIWKESEPSLLRQIHLSFWFLIIARELARTIGLARETNSTRRNDHYLSIHRDAPDLIDLATRQDSRFLATGIKDLLANPKLSLLVVRLIQVAMYQLDYRFDIRAADTHEKIICAWR